MNVDEGKGPDLLGQLLASGIAIALYPREFGVRVRIGPLLMSAVCEITKWRRLEVERYRWHDDWLFAVYAGPLSLEVDWLI